MKKRIAICMAALLGLVGLTTSFAADEVISVKTGDVVFKTMNTDMKTLYPNADIAFISVDDANQRLELNTGKNGAAKASLKDGRYLLEVGGSNVAIVEASAKGQLQEVRLLAADASVMVGGQDDAELDKVIIPGAGEEPVEVEDATLVEQDDGQYIETSEGALIKAVEDTYTEIDEGNFIRTVDGRWWRLSSEAAGAAGGKKKGLVLVAAGVVAVIVIAAVVDDDDDDDDTPTVISGNDPITTALDSAEATVSTARSTAVAEAPASTGGSSAAAVAAPAAETTRTVRTGGTGGGGGGGGGGTGGGGGGGGPVSP